MASFETIVSNDTTDETGTRTLTVAGGFRGDHTDFGPGAGRMPAFIGLAREAGGAYVENTEGLHIDEALKRAGLDFTVKLADFTVTDGADVLPNPSNLRATVGTWTDGRKTVLGAAGPGYTPVQPVQAAHFGQAVLDEGGATVVAAAAYGEPRGSRMYLALKLPEGLLIGGDDPHDLYLTIGNSFNRTTGLWGCIAPIRNKCTNQTTATFFGIAHRFAIRHTGDMEYRIGDVRRTLDLTNTFAEAYDQAAKQMLSVPMGRIEVAAFVDKLMPTPADVISERGAQGWDDKRAAVCTLITDGPLNEFGRGTRYAAYQGVAEWVDHVKDAKTRYGQYMRLVDGGETEKVKIAAGRLLMAGS